MMIHRCAIVRSFATIVSLNTILLLGVSVRKPDSIQAIFNSVVAVIDVSLVSSSRLLGSLFLNNQAPLLACLFFPNVVIFIIAFFLRIRGVVFPPIVLFGADLYWLNLYLICFLKCSRLPNRRDELSESNDD